MAKYFESTTSKVRRGYIKESAAGLSGSLFLQWDTDVYDEGENEKAEK